MDEELRQRMLRGDTRALEELVSRYIRGVHRLAELIIGQAGSPQDIEEVTADAFQQAWRRIREFAPERTTLLNWLLMLTKYTALDRRRALLRRRFQADGSARVIPLESAPEPVSDWTPEAAVLRGDSSHHVHAALDRLPSEQRDLLIRRYFYEERIEDLTRELGLKRAALDSRLWRARQALKALLSEPEEEENHG